ncbi:hypothetical protein ACV4VL_26035 [Pseudomonas aeruginosa]
MIEASRCWFFFAPNKKGMYFLENSFICVLILLGGTLIMRNIKRYTLKFDEAQLDKALEIAKDNDFALSKAIYDFIDKYIEHYNENGFKTDLKLKVKIKQFQRKHKP